MKLALDWTPNVMHTGLYVAKAKGWLDIEFISPSVDEYSVLPADKVASGLVDFSIGPPESLISHHLENEQPQLLGLTSILAENTSAIAALQEKKIDSLAKWAGRTYAALGIAYEQQMIEEITRSANLPVHVTSPMKLNTWKMLQNGETDLAWIFLPVEGAEAAYKEIPLKVFRLEEFGVPYAPCPIIKTSRNLAEADPQAIAHFMKAAGRGYQYAVDYPEEGVSLLRKGSENNWIEDPRLLLHCQKEINKYYLNAGGFWGSVDEELLQNYINWLYEKNIIAGKPALSKMLYQASAVGTK